MSLNLNPQQVKFVESYVKLDNATKAAIEAGYSEKTAYSQGARLLKHVEIRTAVQRIRDKAAAETLMDRTWILQRTKRVIDDAMDSDPMNGMVALKGLELVSKLDGLFQDNAGAGMGLSIVLHLGGSA